MSASASPSASGAAQPWVSDVPRFTVDLDAREEDRWTHIIELYKDGFEPVIADLGNIMEAMFGPRLGPAVEAIASGIMGGIARTGFVYYGDELKAIAKVAGISLGRLVILQLAYELAAACTALVTWEPELKQTVLARTMDWELPALKKLTIEVEFVRGGRRLFLATTWAGYVGVLTGLRPGGYALAVNFRSVGETPLKNLMQGLSRAWPVGFLCREVLETETLYQNAVDALSTSELMAPTYLIVAGVTRGQGVVLSRNRAVEDRRQVMSAGTEADKEKDRRGRFLLQCNIDSWISDEECDANILWSIERRRLVTREMERDSRAEGATVAQLWELMLREPVQNEETIYACVMVAGTGLLQTRL